jgi:peptide deformylase
MFRIMNKYGGVGLAAPQVGLDLRIFVWRHDGLDQAIWNPILSGVSGNMESTEGCLSLPHVSVTLQRATSSVLSGFAASGRPIRFVGDSNTTRIWQHEIDHLDGKLIIDNMSRQETVANREAMRTLLKNVVT